MKYVNDRVCRQNRLMDEERAIELLRDGEYGVLDMVSEDMGYGIPVNFARDDKSSTYIYCTLEGHKSVAIEQNPKVSLCVIGKVNLLPRSFATEHESAIFFGEAHIHLSEEEKVHTLHLLMDKLSPDFGELGDKYAHTSFHRVEIIRADLSEFSGKRKKVYSSATPTGDQRVAHRMVITTH